jgi:hypothetical protein
MVHDIDVYLLLMNAFNYLVLLLQNQLILYLLLQAMNISMIYDGGFIQVRMCKVECFRA